VEDDAQNGADELVRNFMKLAAALTSSDHRPADINGVAKLFESAERMPRIVELIDAILPAEVDAEQWWSWLEGGPPPAPRLQLKDPDSGRKPAARGAWLSVVHRREVAEAKADRLRDDLKLADDALKQLREEEAVVQSRLRTVVMYRVLQQIGDQTAGLFALGPAWTLMRVVSGFIQSDPAFEGTLDEAGLKRLSLRKLDRHEDTATILELLDRYCGDERLEMNLHRVILKALKEHHEPIQAEIDARAEGGKKLSLAAKQPRRTSAARQSTVRPGAAISDREEVLDGMVAAVTSEGRTEGENPLDNLQLET